MVPPLHVTQPVPKRWLHCTKWYWAGETQELLQHAKSLHQGFSDKRPRFAEPFPKSNQVPIFSVCTSISMLCSFFGDSMSCGVSLGDSTLQVHNHDRFCLVIQARIFLWVTMWCGPSSFSFVLSAASARLSCLDSLGDSFGLVPPLGFCWVKTFCEGLLCGRLSKPRPRSRHTTSRFGVTCVPMEHVKMLDSKHWTNEA